MRRRPSKGRDKHGFCPHEQILAAIERMAELHARYRERVAHGLKLLQLEIPREIGPTDDPPQRSASSYKSGGATLSYCDKGKIIVSIISVGDPCFDQHMFSAKVNDYRVVTTINLICIPIHIPGK